VETSLDDYIASMTKLAALASGVTQLLPAHNTANVDPARLAIVLAATKKLRSGAMTPLSESRGELMFRIDGVSFLSSRAAIASVNRAASWTGHETTVPSDRKPLSSRARPPRSTSLTHLSRRE